MAIVFIVPSRSGVGASITVSADNEPRHHPVGMIRSAVGRIQNVVSCPQERSVSMIFAGARPRASRSDMALIDGRQFSASIAGSAMSSSQKNATTSLEGGGDYAVGVFQ